MSNRKLTGIVAAAVILIALGLTIWVLRKPAPRAQSEPEKIAAVVSEINQANVGLPEAQIQAKGLVMTAMVQKAIPAAANWCDTLNEGHKLWPVTPTNTVFALNTQVAGTAFARGMRGDVVAFFQAATPGWNQSGGVELLANNPQVAVVMLDGRALILARDDAVKLHWAP